MTPCQHSLMVWWGCIMVNQLTVSPWSYDTDPLSTLPHGVVRVYDGEPTHCVSLESRHWHPVNTPSWCGEGVWRWTNSLCLPGVKTLTPCQHSLMVWWGCMMVNQLTVSPWSQDTDPQSTLPHDVLRVYDGEPTHCVSLESRHWPAVNTPLIFTVVSWTTVLRLQLITAQQQSIFQDFEHVGVNQPLEGPFPPNPFLPYPPNPLPCLTVPSRPSIPHPFPSTPLEVGPLNPDRGSGEHCKLLQRGLGQSPSRNWIWCILALKSDIWPWESNNQISCKIS